MAVAVIVAVVKWVVVIASVAYSAYNAVEAKKAQARAKKAAQAAKDAATQSSLRTTLTVDPVAPTRYIYGRARIAGAIAFGNSTETSGSWSGIYMNTIQILADHSIAGFEGVYANDDYAADRYGIVQSKFYSGSIKYLDVWLKNGKQSGPDYSMVSRFGSDIDSSFKFTDISYMGISMRVDPDQNVWPTGNPVWTAIVKGKDDIYDPRTGTYGWSENPALIIRDILTEPNLGNLPVSALDDASFISCANFCDGTVQLTASYSVVKTGCYTNTASMNIDLPDTNGIYVGMPVTGSGIAPNSIVTFVSPTGKGVYVQIPDEPTVHNHNATLYFGSAQTGVGERRYTAWGSFTTDISLKEVLEDILTSCNGKLVITNGKITLQVGQWRSPVMTITADDLVDGIGVSVNASQRNSYNTVKATYINPDDFYRAASTEPYTSTLLKADDAGYEKTIELSFNWTPTHTMAQRLQKQALFENSLDMTIDLKCKLNTYKLQPGDNFYFNYDRLGFANKLFVVEKIEIDYINLTTSISAKETDSSVYAWDPNEQLVYSRGKNSILPDPWYVEAPSNVQAVGGSSELKVLPDGTIIPRAKLSWSQPNSLTAAYQIQYKRQSSGDWINFGEINNNSITNYVHIELSSQEETYDFRIRAKSYLLRYSNWVYTSSYIAGKSQAPLEPSNVQIHSYSGSIKLDWDNNLAIDVDYDRTRVWVSPINDVDTAIPVIEISSTSYTYIDDEVGNFYFWLQNIDTTGNQSGRTGSFIGNVSGIVGTPGTPGADAYTFNVSNESIFGKLDERGHLLPSFTLSGSLATTVTAFKGTSSLVPAVSYLDVGPGEFAISLQNENNVIVGKTADDTYEIISVSDTKGDFTIRVYLESQTNFINKKIAFNGVIDQLPASKPQYVIIRKGGSAQPPYEPYTSGSGWYDSKTGFLFYSEQMAVLQVCGGTYANVRTGSVHLYRNGIDVGYEHLATNDSDGATYQVKDSFTGEIYDALCRKSSYTSTASYDNWNVSLDVSGSAKIIHPWNVKPFAQSQWLFSDNTGADADAGYNADVIRAAIAYNATAATPTSATSSLFYIKWDDITSRFAVISSSASEMTTKVSGTDTNILTLEATASNGATFKQKLFATRTEPLDQITIVSKVQPVTASNEHTYTVNEFNATSAYTSSDYSPDYIRQRYNNGTWSDARPVTRLGSQWYYNTATQPIGYGYVDYHFDTASGFFNALDVVYPSASVGITYTDNNPSVLAKFDWLTVAQTLSAIAVDSGSIGPSGSIGTQGPEGSYFKNIYTRSPQQPATPTGSAPIGWYDYIPDGGSPVWVCTGRFDPTDTIIGSWSTPNRWSGPMTFIESFFPDPANYDLVNNDLLIHTGEFNKIYRYYNGAWLDAQRKISWEDVNTGSLLIADAAVVGTAVINNAAIQDLAVTNAKIASGSIKEAQIDNAAITNAKIADAAITNAKIADAAITNAKIVNVDANKINAGTISSVYLATSYLAGNVAIYNTADATRTFPTTAHVYASNLSVSTSTDTETYITSDDLIFTGWLRGSTGFLSSRFGHPSLRMDIMAACYITDTDVGENNWMQFGVAFRTRTNGGAWGSWQIGGWIDKYVGGITDAPSIQVSWPYNYSNNLTGNMDVQIGVYWRFIGRTSGTISTNNLQVSARIYNF